MKLLDKHTGLLIEAIIKSIQKEDWIILDNSKQFIFNWKLEEGKLIYKITLKSASEILGLISIEDIPKEQRLHIHLIENSNLNKGKAKVYDYIAGCLIAYICQLAFEKGYDGFVSLEPKTALVALYQNKYGFRGMGKLLYTMSRNSETLIKKYIDNE